MNTSDLIAYYELTGVDHTNRRTTLRLRDWASASAAFQNAAEGWRTATLWRVNPHHRRTRVPGHRFNRSHSATR